MRSTDPPRSAGSSAPPAAAHDAALVRRPRGLDHDLRYEIKMVVKESAYAWARQNLFLDQAGVRTLYPPRRVQSIYFDTLGQAALEENLAGISHREKVRFRWYGEGRQAVRGQLERKVRHNQLGWKNVLRIPASIDVEGARRTDLARAVFEHLDAEWSDVRAGSLLPVQWITYLREYYTTADGAVRVTMDRELRTYDQRNRMRVSSAYANHAPRVLIVEAKCADADHEAARRLLSRFTLVVDKCSKFVIASRPLEGPSISIFE